jgi:hypothetical protein
MKVTNIPVHRVQHIWMAFVKKTLAMHPQYRRKDTGKYAHYNDIVIQRKSGERWIEVISYNRFKRIVEYLFDDAKNAIIQGDAFNLPSCGKILVKRVQRDFRAKKRPVDWARTTKKNTEFDENGKRIYRKLYYHNGDDYLRVTWIKAEIPNQTVYEFVPAAADRHRQAGFKYELAQANVKDPLLKLRYLFNPLKDFVIKEIA